MPEIEYGSNRRLIKTFGRLKGRPLSKNQKLGLAILKEKYNLFLETKNPKIVYRKVDIPAENIKVYINFLSLINQKNEIKKISLVLVTHNSNLAKKCDKVIKLFDGQVKN